MSILSDIKMLSENHLREKIIVPLLHTLTCEDIYSYHGNREKGKDIVYKTKNIYKEAIVGAIILKKGDIKKTSLTKEIKTQTEESMESFIYPCNHSETVYINELSVIISGSFSKDALEYLHTHSRRNFPNVFILDGNKINTLIIKTIQEYNVKYKQNYTFAVDTFADICANVTICSNKSSNNLSSTASLEGSVLK